MGGVATGGDWINSVVGVKFNIQFMKKPKFSRGQLLIHVETETVYCITELPRDCMRLEYCNEPYYSYRSYGEETDHLIWVRRQSEMEDGRFIKK